MDKKVHILFLGISSVLVLLRIFFISNTMLIDDEAYYAMYARHLSWGYIDHGPVVAYVIRLFTLISENDFTVRLGGIVMITWLSMVMYTFGKEHFNQRTGVILSLSVTANMMFHTNAVVMTPDAPMVFFTMLAILYYYKAYFVDPKYLYGAGALLGLAVLSKISALFPAMGILLFPVLVREKRHFLRNKHFYGALIVAFIVFTPFVIWNLQNDLAFVRYQGRHITRGVGWTSFIELWSALFLLTGPVLFYYTVTVPVKTLLRVKPASTSLIYFALVTAVPLAYFVVHSLVARMEVNWPAPVFFGGLFLFGIVVGENWPVRRKGFLFQIGYSLFLILLVTAQTFQPFLPLKGKSDITRRYFLYTAFPDELATFLRKNPEWADQRIVANQYQIPAMINFYLHPKLEAVCLSIGYHPTLYSFLYPENTLVGQDFLLMNKGRKFPKKLKPYFESVDLVTMFASHRSDCTVATYSLWSVTGFSGSKPAEPDGSFSPPRGPRQTSGTETE